MLGNVVRQPRLAVKTSFSLPLAGKILVSRNSGSSYFGGQYFEHVCRTVKCRSIEHGRESQMDLVRRPCATSCVLRTSSRRRCERWLRYPEDIKNLNINNHFYYFWVPFTFPSNVVKHKKLEYFRSVVKLVHSELWPKCSCDPHPFELKWFNHIRQ